ncbi:hypothetical protein WIS52_01295 [Pseudonocardia nematodicida]|uniref:Mce-associated membrane protein n=1 Tax=Pseudonocardia nematodicida TaxID=1206997 RepID=A0ABV1K3Q9_9PSEU
MLVRIIAVVGVLGTLTLGLVTIGTWPAGPSLPVGVVVRAVGAVLAHPAAPPSSATSSPATPGVAAAPSVGPPAGGPVERRAAPPVAATEAAPVTPAEDGDAPWRRWLELNDVCRGTTGPDGDQACLERAELQERLARESADAFLRAWAARDAVLMGELATDDATDTFGRPLVANLLEFSPAEDRIDLRYDVEGSGVVAGYVTTTAGPNLYLQWDMDYERGWLVTRFAPDVG